MCGIVGYVGPRPAAPIILEGLRRLEYRGYDSAGLAVIQGEHIEVRRNVGKLSALVQNLAQNPVHGHIGIGHTRWATHGKPSEYNAHPHRDCSGEIVVIHNGIVENFLELRRRLRASGHIFRSETDTEVMAHLVEEYMAEGASFLEAVRRMLGDIQGAHGIVVMSIRAPGQLVAARLGNAGGVTLGIGDGEMFIASDLPAILEHTRRMVFLEDRQMALVQADGFQCFTLEGRPFTPQVHEIPWDPVSAAKGEYKHFMQKEMYEQARSITDTIRGRVDFERGEVYLSDVHIDAQNIWSIHKVVIVACGTSYYAGLVGKFLLESLARLP
ncbi:MAG: isomerizing glutamine--fructose-6-phosphate transaminase, partial [Anaerolineae bacterium]